MTDPFRKVKSGDPLSIPATAYNAMLDAAVANMRLQNRPAPIRGDHGVYVMVLNDTGHSLEQFEVLGIDGPVFHPRDQLDAFQQTPVLSGVVPEEKHKGKFVVIQEPAEVNSVVRACISGMTVARVYVEESENEDHTPKACDIEEDNTYNLTGSSSGGASILWIENGSGEKWALIRIGHGDTSTLFPVMLENTTGGEGDHESQCDFYYDIYEFPNTSGGVLAENLNPNEDDFYRRPDIGKMKAATFGIAFYNDENELKIAWCNEVMETKSCSSDSEEEDEET